MPRAEQPSGSVRPDEGQPLRHGASADHHAIRRTDPGFWAASDALMQAYQRWAPAEAGLLDYGRLQKR